MPRKLTKLMKGIFLILMLAEGIFSQLNQFTSVENIPGVNPPFIGRIPKLPTATNRTLTKRLGHYSREDWQHLIDSVWGPGLPTATKLQIFDRFWGTIDTGFACFHNNPVNWDSLKALYRPEIANGVSKGRFCAILEHLALLLRDSHTSAIDLDVINTAITPGIPLLVLAGWEEIDRFGAGLTPLPDSSLLVYKVIPSHPLGLQRGDIVLGYDRIPWRILVRQLIDYQLPYVVYGWKGSSQSAFNHVLLMGAGLNFHLFDTIDVVRYTSGDTVHLSTIPLQNINTNIFCTEQMDIPGIPKPNFPQQVCSHGIITGTNIGYIYCWAWINGADTEFYNAVQALMQTDGLIIDFRFNGGGGMFLSNPGLSLLFDSSYYTIDFGRRCSPNHQEMCPMNISYNYVIPGSPPGYNKPIAVLTGPGAVSSGDQVALRMKYHRHSRLFGKSTASAFNSPVLGDLNPGFFFRYGSFDAYQLSNPGVYLTHTELPVDTIVWLSPSLVSQGRDDVEEAAVAWISKVIGISNLSSEVPQKFSLGQNYPNPFNPVTKIKFELAKSGSIQGMSLTRLIIYDVLGREVTTLVNENLSPGTYEVDWNASNYASGVYYYRLETQDFSQTKKMLLVK